MNRPVSLHSRFTQTLVKYFIDRLDKYLNEHKLLIESWHGFMSNWLMFNALIELNEEITNCISQRTYAHGVFIDLKKAVDTLANHILIDKLEMYDIRWVALDWMKSYINNRQQFMKVGEH